jgi:sulfite reductase (NADPH) flavoprotein alpha-component
MSIKYHRQNPFHSKLVERVLLTKESAVKKTYHIALSLAGSEITYRPGDSIAVIPSNDPEEVERLLSWISGADERMYYTLMHRTNLKKVRGVPDRTLMSVLSERRWSQEELRPHLLPMLPRFYSIGSSPLLYPEEVHLAIAEVDNGVATRFLCSRVDQSSQIPIYLQPTQKFLLPVDSTVPLILIGSGTGVAPFRAFLQHRMAQHAPGRNWLFFGGRNDACDFLYQEYWASLPHLRLSCAFSRDTPEKIYVQHKLWEEREEVRSWIDAGAWIYVCGSIPMGKDVEATLHQMVDLKALRSEGRYLTDVY